ncbi:HD domain-containing protein [Acetobacteraceae bacterium H6797]|nr:HD domain-containing protein [Acetobacteraceae bacterium H6797]
MAKETLRATLNFLREAEKLKDVLRNSHTSTGRRESTAEHSWRLCLMAMVLAEEFPGLDMLKLMKMCLVHDLGEALHGDIPATDPAAKGKAAVERQDLSILVKDLPAGPRAEILSLWDEYDAASSPEARIAKGLDKLETILQHNQGSNAPSFDHAFNLLYGQAYTAAHPVLAAIRELIDEETRAKLAQV